MEDEAEKMTKLLLEKALPFLVKAMNGIITHKASVASFKLAELTDLDSGATDTMALIVVNGTVAKQFKEFLKDRGKQPINEGFEEL